MKRIAVPFAAVLAIAPFAVPDLMADPSASPGVSVEMATPAAQPAEAPSAPASDVSVEDISVGSGVQDRAIAGAADSFSAAATPSVACFTKVKAKSTPTTVKHVYTKDGQPSAEVALDIGGSPWRTWSTRKVQPGAWKVEVVDEAGTVVASKEFTVTE